MIVLSAFVPYPPYSLENSKDFEATLNSYKKIEEELYAAKPDVILVIGKHDELLANAFSGSVNDVFRTSFGLYGDFENSIKVKGSVQFMQQVSEKVQTKLPFVQFSEENLPFSISVVAHLLTSKIKNARIAPVYYSIHDNQKHLEFGELLREAIEESGKRVAVIAVGNLSHCLYQGKFSKKLKGKDFDDEIIESLKTGSTEKLQYLDKKLMKKAKECGLKQLLILMGVLQDAAYETEILSYEHPYGVGYLSAIFRMHGTN